MKINMKSILKSLLKDKNVLYVVFTKKKERQLTKLQAISLGDNQLTGKTSGLSPRRVRISVNATFPHPQSPRQTRTRSRQSCWGAKSDGNLKSDPQRNMEKS